MANIMLFSLLFATYCANLSVTINSNITILLPLSGEKGINGEAQREGILHAFEYLGLLNSSYGGIVWKFIDTRCFDTQEELIKLQESALSHSSNSFSQTIHKVLLGDFCQGHDLNLGFVQNLLPQITIHSTVTRGHKNLFSTGINVLNILNAVTALLTENQWNSVWLLYDDFHLKFISQIKDYLTKNELTVQVSIWWQENSTIEAIHNTNTRPILVFVKDHLLSNLACTIKRDLTPGRNIWIIPKVPVNLNRELNLFQCYGKKVTNSIIVMAKETFKSNNSAEKLKRNLKKKFQGEMTNTIQRDAFYAFDSALVVGNALMRMQTLEYSLSREEFLSNFSLIIQKNVMDGLTGRLEFGFTNKRLTNSSIYQISEKGVEITGVYEKKLKLIKNTELFKEPATTQKKIVIDGIPLALFIIMTALMIVCILYAIVIITFILMWRNDKMIKMTSPNINVIICFGIIMANVSVVLFGIDTKLVTPNTMQKFVSSGTFLLSCSFTIVYCCLFSKAWRVYLIFKNISFNGKTARDEHLVISVCAFLVIDLIILLPWILADPIKCEPKLLGKSYKSEIFVDEFREIVDCKSSLQILWISLIYTYKLIQLIIGSMATWKTRHVTLPTLKDAKEIFSLIIAIVILGIIALPLMLADSIGSTIKYTVGSLIAWFGCVCTLTLAFIPKLYLTRKHRSQGTTNDANRLLFTESLRRTQANDKPWFMCCSGSGNNMDMYAEEMLSQEIENLNRTIKQKDATIRDLTDRLYFHQYIGKARQRRHKAPPTAETSINNYTRVTFNRNNPRKAQNEIEKNNRSTNDFKSKDISPNRDSAFDNISPSSTSTEMGRKEMNDRPIYEKGPIDVEAIEKEANLVKDWVDLHSDFVKFQQSSLTNPKRDLSFEQEPVAMKKSIRSTDQPILRPIVHKPVVGRSPFRQTDEKKGPNTYSMHALQI